MAQSLTIDIDEEGNVTIDAAGFTGGACRTATEALEEALGTVKNRELKEGGACSVEERVRTRK